MTTAARQVPIELCGGPLDGERRVIPATMYELCFSMFPAMDFAVWHANIHSNRRPTFHSARYQVTRQRNARGEIIYRFAGIRP